MKLNELPDWDGFLSCDCTPLGELHELMMYFTEQEGAYPAIARYIAYVIHFARLIILLKNCRERIEAPPFEYQPLDFRSNSIRLLRFDLDTPYLPAPDQTCLLVELCMKQFSSDECPEYYALSYVWGSSHCDRPILVNGQLLSITENLLIVLSQLRQKNFEGWIWIDAICIHQDNNLEKGLFLQRMPSIYKGAKSTLAWVGEHDRGNSSQSKDSLLWITRMEVIIQQLVRLPTTENIHSEDENHSTSTMDQIESKDLMALLSTKQDLVMKTMLKIAEILKGRDKECVRTLEELLSHPIWTRIWIVQEFASSGDVVLVNKEQTLELRIFFNLWAVLYQGLNQDAKFGSDLLSLKIRTRIKSMAPMLLLSSALGTYRTPRSLFELLRATGWFRASDSRDRIFALLGIAVDSSELGISAKYELPYENVCAIVSEALMRKYGLSMLSFNAGYTYCRGRFNPSLPSWCSDWTLGTAYTILTDRPAGGDSFDACGTAKGTNPMIFDRTRGTVSLSGTIVDSIRQVQEFDSAGPDPKHVVAQLLSQLRDLSNFKGPPGWPKVPTYVEQALFCVPIAHQRPAPSTSMIEWHGRSQEFFKAFGALSDEHMKSNHSPVESPPLGQLNPYVQEVIRRAAGRAIFACEDNYLGLGPVSMQKRDLMCIFQNSSVPSIIRPLPSGSFLYIGEAYVHGIMYGEYFDRSKKFHQRTLIIE